jgi:hypothetical protein
MRPQSESRVSSETTGHFDCEFVGRASERLQTERRLFALNLFLVRREPFGFSGGLLKIRIELVDPGHPALYNEAPSKFRKASKRAAVTGSPTVQRTVLRPLEYIRQDPSELYDQPARRFNHGVGASIFGVIERQWGELPLAVGTKHRGKGSHIWLPFVLN